MHQRKYALELISETGLVGAKPIITLVDTNSKQITKENDEYTRDNYDPKKDPPTNQNAYQSLIRKLLYLTAIRSDKSFGIKTLSQFLQSLKRYHMKVSMSIVNYINQ